MKTGVTGSVRTTQNLSTGKAISNVNDFIDLRNLKGSFENI